MVRVSRILMFLGLGLCASMTIQPLAACADQAPPASSASTSHGDLNVLFELAMLMQDSPLATDYEDEELPRARAEQMAASPTVQTAGHETTPAPPLGDGQTSAPAAVHAVEEPTEALAKHPVTANPHTDYEKAMREAVEDRKMLFIFFHDIHPTAAQRAFEKETLADLSIQERLRSFVFVRLPLDAQIKIQGQPTVLLDHPAFSEMHKRQGIAIVDLAHDRADYFGQVVSTFPFTPGKYYRKEALAIILGLPPGTLTQRTMIYAVRIHPERPASTQGHFHGVLAEEAKLHADHQASILVQGHHSWDSRFHRINSKLPNGTVAQEVVAESWPNESLVEACIDCVDSWRQSPGHWGAVRSRHPLFGYDIKRGRNGIWYATGIFGLR